MLSLRSQRGNSHCPERACSFTVLLVFIKIIVQAHQILVCVIKEEIDDEPPSEKEGSEFGNVSSLENDAKMKEDVKQGIMLLENVVAKKEAHQPKSRKPLADIGNTDVKQGGAKPKQRKN
ncbi:hypothetical protein ZWY2020_048478 [Hordeum vulgare]|nr:hypothetical protein ZWY2020_048478 [Hordeum vulgare]